MSSTEVKKGFLHGVVVPTVLIASPFWWPVVLLVCLQPSICQSRNGSSQEGRCLCASDILSCTALGLEQIPKEMPVSAVTLDLSHNQIAQLKEASFLGLSRLETLRISHNQLTSIEPRAFHNSSGTLLRHLDLSSNHLCDLEQHYFIDLPGLEELLLFNNRIVRVESAAFAKLSNLRKAYLSHNRLTDFPFFSIQKHTHPQLVLLDLSSNRLPKLPLEDISNLPITVQKGLYLHNNSLVCDCSMYGLFHKWAERNFTSVTDYKEEHTCLVYGMQKGTVRFFKHDRYFEKCDFTGMKLPLTEQEGSVLASAGSAVLLHCVTTLTGQHVTFFWVSPHQEYVAPPGNSDSLKMYSNGSLEIRDARAADSGMYLCMAVDDRQQRNETREVNLTVVMHQSHEPHESFNTGFTTLLGCVVSLVLVLMYLYLTPCRCPPCRKAPPPPATIPGQTNEAGAGSAQSSILTPTPPTTTEGPGRKIYSSNVYSAPPT
ncbi:amphoterin-induced protein 3 [Boleophthalmus pectinirostris]|uniref:amphoterin-induced protein 3 n=1 Tax=Boleophthalmus pectinirostris TaxID=150288 RepID=UPI00242AA07B|nr:amphoterin-induced protein 3 [Boleophthalmus pectinirostris]